MRMLRLLPILLSDGGDKHRFDRVQPVFRLIEHDGGCGFKDLVRHLHAWDAVFLKGFLTHRRIAVVEGGQAMQELGMRVAGACHDGRCDAIGVRSLIRSAQTLSASPIDTQTSV